MRRVLDFSSKRNSKTINPIRYFIAYSICFFALGLGTASLGPLLPFLAKNVEVSLAQISFLFTTDSLGYLVGSVGGGYLYDRFDSKKMMIIALFSMVIISVIIPLTPVFSVLLFVMFLFGVAKGLLDVGCNVNLVWVYQSKVGPYMNGLHFSFGLGAFLAPIIITLIMSLFGEIITWPYWTLGILFLPGIVGLWPLKSPDHPAIKDNTGKKQPINLKLILLMCLLFFLYVSVEVGFSGWIFTYATQLSIASDAAASFMTSLFWGTLTVGRLFSVWILKRTSPSRLLLGNYLLAALVLSLVIIWPSNTTVLWVVSAGLGLAFSSVFPTLLALGESKMEITGKITGLFFLGSSLGGTFVPMLLGQIFEYIGSYQIMLTLFGLAWIGLFVLIFLIKFSNRFSKL